MGGDLRGGDTVAADQVLYNLGRRGPEWDLVPWCREHRVAIMAYTPLGTGGMLGNPALAEIADAARATPAQIALAWLLRQEGTIVIPKASRPEHVRENRGALDVELDRRGSGRARPRLPAAQGQELAGHAVTPVYCALPDRFASLGRSRGGVAERLKAHAWKVCRR